jgi:hypothetical protein
MTWIKADDLTPVENEQVLIHDDKNNRIEFGRYINGRWYIEDISNGELSEVAGVTRWRWVSESELNDDDDD